MSLLRSAEVWQARASAANSDKPGDAGKQEKDKGYGASHGYPPGQSDPSGPGDAPADPSAPAPKPPRDPSEDPNVEEPLP